MRAVAVCRVKFFPVDNLNEDMIMRHQPTFLWPETDKQTDLVLHVGDGVPDNVFTSNYLDELTPVNIISQQTNFNLEIFTVFCLFENISLITRE